MYFVGRFGFYSFYLFLDFFRIFFLQYSLDLFVLLLGGLGCLLERLQGEFKDPQVVLLPVGMLVHTIPSLGAIVTLYAPGHRLPRVDHVSFSRGLLLPVFLLLVSPEPSLPSGLLPLPMV